MSPLLAQQASEHFGAISRRFREHTSLVGALLAVVAVGLVVLLAYWLSKRQAVRADDTARNDPYALFHGLLERLPLATADRVTLRKVAKDQKLEHPAVLLLSRALFRQHTDAWRIARGRTDANTVEGRAIARAEVALFPES